MSLEKIRDGLDRLFKRRRLKGVKISAVRGKEEYILFIAYCPTVCGYPEIPKGFDLVLEPLFKEE